MSEQERLDILEQLEKQTAHKATVAWGLAIGLEDDIRQIKVDMHSIKLRVDQIENRMSSMDEKLDTIIKFLEPKGE